MPNTDPVVEELSKVQTVEKVNMTVEEAQSLVENAERVEKAKEIVKAEAIRKTSEERRLAIAEMAENREKVKEEAVKIVTKALRKVDNAVKGFIEAEAILREADAYINENRSKIGNVTRDSIVNELHKEEYTKPNDSKGVVTKALYGVLKYHRALFRSLK